MNMMSILRLTRPFKTKNSKIKAVYKLNSHVIFEGILPALLNEVVHLDSLWPVLKRLPIVLHVPVTKAHARCDEVREDLAVIL